MALADCWASHIFADAAPPCKRGLIGEKEDRVLGMDRAISRRDFLDGIAIAAGTSLFHMGCRAEPEAPFARAPATRVVRPMVL